MLEETTAREFIEEALTLPGSLFSKYKIWEPTKKMVAKYKRAHRNLQTELSTEFNGWSVMNVLDNLNISILDFDSKEFIDGYSNQNGIAINILADNLIRTAIHEIAHYVLGFDFEDYDLNEAEAEMVCYIVCKQIGIDDDLPYSRHYIKLSIKDGEFPENSKTKCINAAEEIINAGYKDKEEN